MADANARLERLRRCNAVRGQTEPIFRLREASAEEEEEEDLESSYLPLGRTEPSLSFTATTTSRACSGSQLSPAQALAMAQELLRYQPTDDGREGWRARIAELVAIANEDPAQGGAQGAGEPDPVAGCHAPGVEMGRPPRPRKWLPALHLRRAGSPAAKSSNALRKTHASPLSATAKIITAPSTTSVKLARTSRPRGPHLQP
jgi:hypothetical protein